MKTNALLLGMLKLFCYASSFHLWPQTYGNVILRNSIASSSDCCTTTTLLAVSRRGAFFQIASAATGLAWTYPSSRATAAWVTDENVLTAIPSLSLSASSLEMKEFVDPQGFFSLQVPKNFFTLRRSQKGDLPDSKTGKGRRGSSIFTAGDMAKAEVVAVERFPVRVLLEENGIEASGNLSTFPSIGEPAAVARLLVLRREKDTQNSRGGVSGTIRDVQLSSDGKELLFQIRTEIEVQKPELLMEQFGVSQLFRITVAKASLNSNDGNMMVVFASALEQDFNNGVDGPALKDAVESFVSMDQSSSVNSVP